MSSEKSRSPLAITVDVAILTVHESALQVLLVTRGSEPYAGRLALPGGFLEPDENLVDAATRELEEETGVRGVPVEQLRTYGAPHRDPRPERVISVAHVAVVPDPVAVRGGDDVSAADWYDVESLLHEERGRLAFDHVEILGDAVEHVRTRMEYTSLATAFVAEEFSLSELRGVYEAVWGRRLDAGNFQRKVKQTDDLVEPTGETRLSAGGRGRPAAIFRAHQDGVHLLARPLTRG